VLYGLIADHGRTAILGDHRRHPEAVTKALSKLLKEQIYAWDGPYGQHHHALHRWDIWGAAYAINGGCGDDSFHCFKAFAIGKGRAFFLASTDSVGELITDEDLDEGCENESLNDAAQDAQGGDELPSRSTQGSEPVDEAWDEDDVFDLFPKLATKFG